MPFFKDIKTWRDVLAFSFAQVYADELTGILGDELVIDALKDSNEAVERHYPDITSEGKNVLKSGLSFLGLKLFFGIRTTSFGETLLFQQLF